MVLTNQQSGAAFSSISNTIKDGYLGITGQNWVKSFSEREKKGFADAEKIKQKVNADIAEAQQKQGKLFDFNSYFGTYHDEWFGDIILSTKNGKPWISSVRSPKLEGELLSYKGNTLIAKWTDRSMDADAFLYFNLDRNGKPNGFTMEAISPLTDFSFDFQDLDLRRIK